MSDKNLLWTLEDIMGDRFGKYAKFIIQDRALPDVRDGLKPVQRRILYAMHKEGNLPTRGFRKSAKTIGNVIGNYHPHGESSVYDAMVRLSQDWKMNFPLVQMHGNNGSIDNDPAAAMRYTEARLGNIAMELLEDLDKETVLFALNFDDTEMEPTVLPAHYPNLLVNGATGISAGYATDIPPHNLGEVIDATIHRLYNPYCTLSDLMKFIKGPDFPTGGIVQGESGIIDAFTKGKGRVVIRSKVEIEEKKNRNDLVITEIPYEVNKADMVRKMDEIRYQKDIDGIIEVRDETDREGLRIVIEVKKDADIQNILNYFYKNTDLQRYYNYNMVAIKDKRPYLMGIEMIIDAYLEHQYDVITKRSKFDLNKAINRMHIVEGLIKAIDVVDEIIKIIRKSNNKQDSKQNLMNRFAFTEIQAEAIVTLQLYRLSSTDIITLKTEHNELQQTVDYLNQILNDDKVLKSVIENQLKAIKDKYYIPRRSIIEAKISDIVIDKKAMIASDDVIVVITREGYIKRSTLRSYTSSQSFEYGRKPEDIAVNIIDANTQDFLLVFSDLGEYALIPVHQIPETRYKDIGKHLSNLLTFSSEQKIISSILVKDFNLNYEIISATKNGMIKRTKLSDFEVQRTNKTYKYFNLKDNDKVVNVLLSPGLSDLLITTKNGYGLRYNESNVSESGVKSQGIKAISLKDDIVNNISLINNLSEVMLIGDNGEIKKIKASDITFANRATKGMLLFRKNKNGTPLLNKAITITESNEITLVLNDFSFNVINTNDYKPQVIANPLKNILNNEILDYYYNDLKIAITNNTNQNNSSKEKAEDNKTLQEQKNTSKIQKLTIDDFLKK